MIDLDGADNRSDKINYPIEIKAFFLRVGPKCPQKCPHLEAIQFKMVSNQSWGLCPTSFFIRILIFLDSAFLKIY